MVKGQDSFWVYFHSDGSENDWGWKFDVRATFPTPADDSFDHWLVALNGTITKSLSELACAAIDGPKIPPALVASVAEHVPLLHATAPRRDCVAFDGDTRLLDELSRFVNDDDCRIFGDGDLLDLLNSTFPHTPINDPKAYAVFVAQQDAATDPRSSASSSSINQKKQHQRRQLDTAMRTARFVARKGPNYEALKAFVAAMKKLTPEDTGHNPTVNHAVFATAAALIHHGGLSREFKALVKGERDFETASLGLKQCWRDAQATRRAFMVGDRSSSLDEGYGKVSTSAAAAAAAVTATESEDFDDLPPAPPSISGTGSSGGGGSAIRRSSRSLQRANSAEGHVHPNSSYDDVIASAEDLATRARLLLKLVPLFANETGVHMQRKWNLARKAITLERRRSSNDEPVSAITPPAPALYLNDIAELVLSSASTCNFGV